MAKKSINLIGQTFGQLIVLEEIKSTTLYARKYLCRCSCGNLTEVFQNKLRQGITKSCGCLRQKMLINGEIRRTHGESKTKLYKVWVQMLQRCNNPNDSNYHNYGGNGITVITEWFDYQTFKTWAITHGYCEGLTIERLDPYKGYYPENCTWIPLSAQGFNKRKSSKNTSGYEGVSFKKSTNKWVARITIEGIRKQIGSFDSAELAHKAIGCYFLENNLKEHYAKYLRNAK